MPLYDYLCSHCEHQDDVLVKLSDDPLLNCPVCKNKTFKKQVSAPHFKLKVQAGMRQILKINQSLKLKER